MLYENFSNGNFVTAWNYSDKIRFIFISRPHEAKSVLLGVLLLPSNVSKSEILQFTEKIGKTAIDPISFREALPREMREYLSKHLLMGLDQLKFREATATADSAWRYEQLLEWGESSAVAVLAKHYGVNVGTMRARLAQARLNGLLESPGRGSRKR